MRGLEADGALLERAELVYLLSLMHADALLGLDAAPALPADPTSREALLLSGRMALQERGWLTPVNGRRQVHLREEFARLAATLADPEIVLAAAQHASASEQRLRLYYVAGAEIVELTPAAPRRYGVAAIRDRDVLWPRLSRWLALEGTDIAGSTVEIVSDLPVEGLRLVERLATAGQLDAAAAVLGYPGAGSAEVRAFLAALADAGQGHYAKLVALRARGATSPSVRRATVLGHSGAAWVLGRSDPERAALTARRICRGTLAALVGGWIESLRPCAQPRAADQARAAASHTLRAGEQ